MDHVYKQLISDSIVLFSVDEEDQSKCIKFTAGIRKRYYNVVNFSKNQRIQVSALIPRDYTQNNSNVKSQHFWDVINVNEKNTRKNIFF